MIVNPANDILVSVASLWESAIKYPLKTHAETMTLPPAADLNVSGQHARPFDTPNSRPVQPSLEGTQP